jgi:hypothetical protein
MQFTSQFSRDSGRSWSDGGIFSPVLAAWHSKSLHLPFDGLQRTATAFRGGDQETTRDHRRHWRGLLDIAGSSAPRDSAPRRFRQLKMAAVDSHGVTFLYPTGNHTFYYLDTINVTYLSPFASPLLYTYCNNGSDFSKFSTALRRSWLPSSLLRRFR